MKNIYQALKGKAVRVGAGVLALGSVAAHADPVALFTTEMTAVKDSALDMADAAWPFVLAIAGAFILLKLGKRFANKVG